MCRLHRNGVQSLSHVALERVNCKWQVCVLVWGKVRDGGCLQYCVCVCVHKDVSLSHGQNVVKFRPETEVDFASLLLRTREMSGSDLGSTKKKKTVYPD